MKLFLAILLSAGSASAAIKGWPKEIREIKYRSAADDTDQPALHYSPKDKEARPLLVGLHSWSSDYRQANTAYGLWVVKHGWHFIHPNFRGRNRTPQAMGSELAVQDILSAVAWASRLPIPRFSHTGCRYSFTQHAISMGTLRLMGSK